MVVVDAGADRKPRRYYSVHSQGPEPGRDLRGFQTGSETYLGARRRNGIEDDH
jgi:hypothetical protein